MSLAPGGELKLLRHDLEALHGQWGWFLALGIVLIVLGTFALAAPWTVTLTTATFIGVLLILGGVSQAVGAFWARHWSGFFVHLLEGILYLVVGVLAVNQPLRFGAGLTLILAMFLMVGGLFRVIAALSARFPSWGWLVLNGAITFLLGLMIFEQWPTSSLWVIGVFVGIEMIFCGWSWVMLGFALRSLPRGRPAAATV
jgi:uncharacterized membrane protein HdeD (DUF308 family)